MIKQTVSVVNAQGFHMRPADVFSGAMGRYSCDVVLRVDGKEINGKSLMNILAAGIRCGSTVEVSCDGADEQEAMREAVALIESGFGE